MKPGHFWARNFTVDDNDLDFLINFLLERETPLASEELAIALIQNRLDAEKIALEKQYSDVSLYNPSQTYQVEQRIAFSELDFAVGKVVRTRAGVNPDYGTFSVIGVEFDSRPGAIREFASEMTTPHALSQDDAAEENPLTTASDLTVEEILELNRDEILDALEDMLNNADSLIRLSDKWFPRDLIIEINVGHLNLTEAVLDMAEGGPLDTKEILEQIGGLGNGPPELQEFSLNYTLNEDSRFDEVGAVGQVLWYLTRYEPPEVQEIPVMLRDREIPYDRSLLTPEMLELELEIGDNLSPLRSKERLPQADVILTYPHRRLGTLPINFETRWVFPTARQAKRVWVTLVDGQDDEEFTGWVVQSGGYVFGLNDFYHKHHLPIGAHVTVGRGAEPDKIVVDYTAHRPRTEWIRLIVPHKEGLRFENHKRAIGAEYDELMILGVDDLEGVDALFQRAPQQSLTATLKMLIPELGRLSPQGTVHVKTLYSAVNVIRRCPPGPIMATLVANPDFEDVGGHYWRLAT